MASHWGHMYLTDSPVHDARLLSHCHLWVVYLFDRTRSNMWMVAKPSIEAIEAAGSAGDIWDHPLCLNGFSSSTSKALFTSPSINLSCVRCCFQSSVPYFYDVGEELSLDLRSWFILPCTCEVFAEFLSYKGCALRAALEYINDAIQCVFLTNNHKLNTENLYQYILTARENKYYFLTT